MSNIELLLNHGFVMLKNICQSFELLGDKHTDECPRESVADKLNDGCRFEIFPNVFNYAMFRYINKRIPRKATKKNLFRDNWHIEERSLQKQRL